MLVLIIRICPFGIFVCVLFKQKGKCLIWGDKRVFFVIEWLMREIQKKREADLFSTFLLLRTNQIISAGVMAAAEMAKEALAGGSSSASSDGGKLEGEQDEKEKDKGEKK